MRGEEDEDDQQVANDDAVRLVLSALEIPTTVQLEHTPLPLISSFTHRWRCLLEIFCCLYGCTRHRIYCEAFLIRFQ